MYNNQNLKMTMLSSRIKMKEDGIGEFETDQWNLSKLNNRETIA